TAIRMRGTIGHRPGCRPFRFLNWALSDSPKSFKSVAMFLLSGLDSGRALGARFGARLAVRVFVLFAWTLDHDRQLEFDDTPGICRLARGAAHAAGFDFHQ